MTFQNPKKSQCPHVRREGGRHITSGDLQLLVLTVSESLIWSLDNIASTESGMCKDREHTLVVCVVVANKTPG